MRPNSFALTLEKMETSSSGRNTGEQRKKESKEKDKRLREGTEYTRAAESTESPPKLQ